MRIPPPPFSLASAKNYATVISAGGSVLLFAAPLPSPATSASVRQQYLHLLSYFNVMHNS
jgi:hypothetical protein